MKSNFKVLFVLSLVAVADIVLLTRCGSDSAGDALSSANLNQIPDTGTMVASTAGAASISAGSAFKGFSGYGIGLNAAVVVGTPSNVVDILGSATKVDTNFFNGLVATIKDAGSATTTQANQFFGQVVGGPGGQGACQMAQSVAEIVGRTNGNTMCYMKGIASVPTGVTITGATQGDVFTQGANDKHVRINISNMPAHSRGGDGAPSSVHMIVSGSNAVGGSLYKVLVFMCGSNGSVQNSETITVDKSKGLFTDAQIGANGGSGTFGSTVTASLKQSGGTIVFDSTKDREGSFFFSGTYGGQTNTSKGYVKFNYDGTNGDLMHIKQYFGSSWGQNSIVAAAAYNGSKMSNVKFLQDAYSMQNVGTWGGTSHTNSVVAGAAYNTTFYKAIDTTDTTNPLLTEVKAENFATDTFFTDLTAPTQDFSGLDCAATGDVQVAMDFADASVHTLQATCDGDRGSADMYNACYSSDIQTVQGIAQQAFWTAHH